MKTLFKNELINVVKKEIKNTKKLCPTYLADFLKSYIKKTNEPYLYNNLHGDYTNFDALQFISKCELIEEGFLIQTITGFKIK
tara:strand:- start:116 stop:364 length:249 start_codon:yes stop_codon:yes gene_type:complete